MKKEVTKELILENLTKRNTPKPSFLKRFNLTAKECYDIIHGPTICEFCDKIPNFRGFTRGYSPTCGSNKCATKKRYKTNQERYGVENIFQSKQIKERIIENNLKKYGVKNIGQSELYKNIMLEKYGVENSMFSEEVKDKIKKTNLEKYGVEWVLQSEEVKDKIKQTCIERYGVENSFQYEGAKKKFRETCIEKYGADNVFGSDYFRKLMEEKDKWIKLEDKTEFELYGMKVWKYTNKSPYNLLENSNLRTHIKYNVNAHHLDHKYSIKQGFLDNICPKIIGSIHNLEFIPAIVNISKGANCSITKEELLKLYEGSLNEK